MPTVPILTKSKPYFSPPRIKTKFSKPKISIDIIKFYKNKRILAEDREVIGKDKLLDS